MTTVTSVGYGDRFPVTAAGRAIAAVLMVAGIALFGVVTANLAGLILERDDDTPSPGIGRLHAKLDETLARLAALEAQLRSSPTTRD